MCEIVRNFLSTPEMSISRSDGSDWAFHLGGTRLNVPGAVGDFFMVILQWGFYLQILAWGTLWYIVKRVNDRT
jgi:hypothetical protein